MEETYRIAALVERVHSGEEPVFDLEDVVKDLGGSSTLSVVGP